MTQSEVKTQFEISFRLGGSLCIFTVEDSELSEPRAWYHCALHIGLPVTTHDGHRFPFHAIRNLLERRGISQVSFVPVQPLAPRPD